MEKKKLNEVKGDFVPMPEKMHLEQAATQERTNVQQLLESLKKAVKAIRDKGISINSEKDLRGFTVDYVHTQVAISRKKRLEDTPFLPSSIKRNEERQFAVMEKELVTVAESLQGLLAQISFPICFDTDNEPFFDPDKVESYISEKSSVPVPEYVRQYYAELQKVCKAWNELSKWTLANGLGLPTMEVARKLLHEDQFVGVDETISGNAMCVMSLSSEEMFNLYVWGKLPRIV